MTFQKYISTIKKNTKFADVAAILFFVAFLVLGFLLYQDYGISWDEIYQLDLGYKTYHFILNSDPGLLTVQNRWHGSLFELFLIIAQDHSSDQSIYFSRHLITFLAFYSGSICFYFLSRRVLKHNWLALLAAATLIISPTIFANSFYNTKDIPFLVFYIFSLITLLYFLDRPNLFRALVHALFTAMLTAIRMPGLFIPVLTILALLYELFNKRIQFRCMLWSSIVYLSASILLLIIIWPSLWPDPINGLYEAFKSMSHFSFNSEMLFMGKIITPSSIPWYYIPVWMGITVPIFYLLAFFPGLGIILHNQKNILHRNISIQYRDEILILLAFSGPLLVVIILNSTLYDGWRQMFFIYPAFLLVSAKGMHFIWILLKNKLPYWKAQSIGNFIIIISLVPVVLWMIKEHPYQNVYFNFLAGKNLQTIQKNYMVDYWGLSYREGLEYLVSIDDADQINVYAETGPGEYNIPLLPLEDATRVHIVRSLSEADYYIGNYYMQKEPYPLSNEIFSVQVGNAKILSIFILTHEEKY